MPDLMRGERERFRIGLEHALEDWRKETVVPILERPLPAARRREQPRRGGKALRLGGLPCEVPAEQREHRRVKLDEPGLRRTEGVTRDTGAGFEELLNRAVLGDFPAEPKLAVLKVNVLVL